MVERTKQHTIHHREIAALGIFPEQAAHSRPGEDGLGDQRAGKQDGNVQADNGHNRESGISQSMFVKHSPFGQPLGARRPDVVQAEDFQNTGADKARVVGRGDNDQRRYRQDQVAHQFDPNYWGPKYPPR